MGLDLSSIKGKVMVTMISGRKYTGTVMEMVSICKMIHYRILVADSETHILINHNFVEAITRLKD